MKSCNYVTNDHEFSKKKKKEYHERKKKTYLIRDWKRGLRAEKWLNWTIQTCYPPFKWQCWQRESASSMLDMYNTNSYFVFPISVSLCLRSLCTMSRQEVLIPNLLDFECSWTGFLDEHCGVLTAAFCDSTTIKRKMSASTLISFSSLFFCFDLTYTLQRHKCSQTRDACWSSPVRRSNSTLYDEFAHAM